MLIKRKEYFNDVYWYEIDGTRLVLDENKRGLFLFNPPKDADSFDIELEGDCEGHGEIFDIYYVGEIKKLKSILQTLE